MSGVYTYYFCDLLTNTILGTLPLQNVQFSNQLNGAGEFTAEVPISDRRVQALGPVALTQPGRTAVYVDRDGVLVWGGIVWTRRYSATDGGAATAGTLQITGNEFWSYFGRVFANAGYSFLDVDQLTIAQSLIGTASGMAQSTAYSNIGVQVGSNTSGIIRTLQHYSYELKPFGDAVEEMSILDGGFDFAIDVAWVNGVPTKTFNLGYPRRGRAAYGTGLVFNFPGNIIEFDWEEDATSQATRLFVSGAGEGDSAQITNQVAQDQLNAGYPLLDATISFKDNTISPSDADTRAVLAARARAESAALAATVTVPTFMVRADRDPVLGAYIVGDSVTIAFAPAPPNAVGGYGYSPRFPQGMTTSMRIQTIQVNPQQDTTAEEVTLTVGPDITYA